MEAPESNKQALRFNQGKLAYSLVHWASMAIMIQVLMFGAKKYAPDNWKNGMNRKKILESLQRHVSALFDGETVDPESGLNHIGHVMCNAMFYSYYVLHPELETKYEPSNLKKAYDIYNS